MPIVEETAYPYFRTNTNPKDLIEIYTPNEEEISFAKSFLRSKDMELCFLILFKSFQRLGYFVPTISVPITISKHIAGIIGCELIPQKLETYDKSRNIWSHKARIRHFMKIKPVGPATLKFLDDSMRQAAITKQDLVDIVNIGIEELVRNRFELPAFDTLNRIAKKARAKTNNQIYCSIYSRAEAREYLIVENLLKTDPISKKSSWNQLRQDPGKPTLKELKELVDRLLWLREINQFNDPFKKIPYAKIRHLALEANTLDVARMRAVSAPKRFALAVALIKFSLAGVVDDLCDILIRKMNKINNKAKEKLENYLTENLNTTDEIIVKYKEIHDLVTGLEPPEEKIASIKALFDNKSNLLEYSKQHAIYGSKNYFRFLLSPFKSYRSAFFSIIGKLTFVSTSSDKSLENAIAFALANKASKSATLSTRGEIPLIDLSWISDAWWYLVTGQKRRKPFPIEINRQQFEICLFMQVVQELKSADLCVEESEKYVDFREQLISWEEYHEKSSRYTEISGIPTEKNEFISTVNNILKVEADNLDRTYTENKEFQILDNGDLSLKRIKAKAKSELYNDISELISERMPQRNILDILIDTQKQLNWCRVFGPVSGLQTKLQDPESAYVISSFCYGSNLGPVQTARALPILDRKQIAWINQRHITEENLHKAIEIIINSYNKFTLPKFWGDTSSVSADGMKWDLYENNLLSEYHIRYGGYGGVGYYHVSDTYIALFSRFIPCGVYEAIYILDPFFQNKSEIQPDTIHADTHGQSLTVFALAFLLGIQLMPRIANWKSLKIFKPLFEQYQNIGPLFSKEEIDWEIIGKHLPDMLRIAISIQEGRIAPSVILRRLGTNSRKNKIYFAFQELGKAIRSGYLLRYLSDPDLRRKVNHATTVSPLSTKKTIFSSYQSYFFALTAKYEIPFSTQMKRSCRLATSDVFPQTPCLAEHPLFIAVS